MQRAHPMTRLACLWAVVFLCLPTWVGAAQDPSLIGWWRLDEPGGPTVLDASGAGNDGALVGAATRTAALYGRGVYLDGSEAYVEVPNILTPACTLAFWFKPDWDGTAADDYRLFDASTSTIYFFIGKGANHNDMGPEDFGFYLEDAADADFQNIEEPAAGNFFAGEWTHVAVTWQFGGGAATLYINGEEVASATGLGDFPTLYESLHFGYQTVNYISMTNGAASVLDDIKIFDRVLAPEEIPGIMEGSSLELASGPVPADESDDIERETILAWTPGLYADSHDVYLGTNLEDVNSADRLNDLGVLVSQGQDANTFDPPGRLDFGQTYYWRVDEINAPPSNAVFRGQIWSFTTEPRYYPVPSVQVEASIPTGATSGPLSVLVDGTGLTDGLHNADNLAMWSGTEVPDQPTQLIFTFDRVYELHGLHVWNFNVAFEFALGFGAKDIRVEVAAEPNQWVTLGDYTLTQGSSAPGDPGQRIEFDGVLAQAVRLTVLSTFKERGQVGLSEIQFLYQPNTARQPDPADGATDVGIQPTLRWRPGRLAGQHRVTFGTDAAAVQSGTAPSVVTTDRQWSPGTLDLETTYYWQVAEINDLHTPAEWVGPLWQFSTPAALVVDGMESYNDDDNRIYQAWADGFDDPANGSQVGYTTSPFAEKKVVYAGRQSMPLFYDNTGTATESIATRTFSPPLNWSVAGIETLVLFVHGDLDNTGGQFFLEVNGRRTTLDLNLALPLWTQWNIPLASLGVNLGQINTISLGVTGAGRGVVTVDDLKVYRLAPPAVRGSDPGTDDLALYYNFENAVTDQSNHGLDGTAQGVPFYNDSLLGFGMAMSFDGVDDLVEVPVGTLVSELGDCSITAWVRIDPDATGSWMRVFDFGTDTTNYLFLSPRTGTNGPVRVAILTPETGGEIGITSTSPLTEGWHHLAVVFEGTALRLVIDGQVAGTVETTAQPKDLGVTPQNWLGDSQWTADDLFYGQLDEFRIYRRTLSLAEIRFLAGDQ